MAGNKGFGRFASVLAFVLLMLFDRFNLYHNRFLHLVRHHDTL